MAGNLRDIKELEAEIEAAGLRGITKQQILDSLRSQAKVAASLSLRDDATQTTVAGWNRLDLFDTARSTQGIFDGLTDETDPGAWVQVRNAAAGDYTCDMALRFTADTNGTYEFRITYATDTAVPGTYVGQFSPYRDAVTVVAGEVAHVAIAAALLKDVARNERLQVEYKGPNNSVITGHKGQFGAQR